MKCVCAAVRDAAPTYLAEMVTPLSASETSPFRNTWHSGSTALQNDETRTKKLRCLWSEPVELTAATTRDPSLTQT